MNYKTDIKDRKGVAAAAAAVAAAAAAAAAAVNSVPWGPQEDPQRLSVGSGSSRIVCAAAAFAAVCFIKK